jgi:hypothetical protein
MAVSQKQQQQILEMVASGSSLRSALKRAEVPSTSTWFDLIDRDASVGDQYAHARMRGYEARADKLHDDCWDMTIDPAHKRIITDVQKWELSKCLPKVYGDRLTLDGKLTSKGDELTDEQLQAIIAAKQAK